MHRTLTNVKPHRGPLGLLGVIVLVGLLLWNPLAALDDRVAPAALASSALVRVEPAELVVDPGADFTVDVLVENVSELGGYEFKLRFDPGVLEVTAAENGDFLGSTGRTVIPIDPNIDRQAGVLLVAAASMGAASGAEGAGTLAVITLTAVGQGVTDLDLYDVKLADPAAGRIGVAAEAGRVMVGTGTMPTRVPTEVPAASPTPTPTPTVAPAVTGTPAEADVPPTGTPAVGVSPTPEAVIPTEEAEAATATAAAGVTPDETAERVTPSPGPGVATATRDPAVGETAEPAERATDEPDPLATDAGQDTTGTAGTGSSWLLIGAAVLAVVGLAAVAAGVLWFKPKGEPSEES